MAKSLKKVAPVQRTAEVSHLADLVPDPANRRSHNPRNIGMVVDALQAVGAARSIVIDEDNVVLAGNGVVEAAAEAGLTRVRVVEADGSEVIAVRRRGLTQAQKRALAIYDNRTGELAEWNAEQLAADVAAGLDLKPWFGEEELAGLLGTTVKAGLTDPDAVPEVRATDIQVGDLFELGKHRLLCGDSTTADDVARLMGGVAATVVLTDPPYGMDLDTDWTGVIGAIGAIGHGIKGDKYAKVVGDDAPFDPSPLFVTFASAREMFLFGADYYAERIPSRASGSWLVWDKRKPSQSDAIGAEFELIWSKVKHKRRMLRHDWFGFLSSANRAEAHDRLHPTQKPTSLLVDILTQWSKPADVLSDTYAGSGSTVMACEQTSRSCYAAEIVPAYCQVIIDRWEQFTGLKANKVGEAVRA